MANIYMQHGDNDDLRSRAEEIATSRSGDVRVMQDSLAEWDETGTAEHGDGVDGRTGPAGRDAGHGDAGRDAELEAARGLELDDLFTR